MHRQCSSDVMEPIGSDRNGPRRMQPSRTRHFLLSGLLAALLGVAGATPIMAAPPLLPPVVDPASQEHHVGKVILVELVTPDLAAAKQFYAGLFGWTYRDMPTDGTLYAEASLDGRPVAGLVQRQIPAGEHRQPAWLTFIAAHDVDATTQLAVQHGAKVLFEPHSLPDRGREAVLADPQGRSSRSSLPAVVIRPTCWAHPEKIAKALRCASDMGPDYGQCRWRQAGRPPGGASRCFHETVRA